jgi:hypothetical protein
MACSIVIPIITNSFTASLLLYYLLHGIREPLRLNGVILLYSNTTVNLYSTYRTGNVANKYFAKNSARSALNHTSIHPTETGEQQQNAVTQIHSNPI